MRSDPWAEWRRHTPARIALGRSGQSLPTAAVLQFAADHAAARDAVHVALDLDALQQALNLAGFESLMVTSQAPDRQTYLRRPDLGRRLSDSSLSALRAMAQTQASPPDPATAAIDLAVVLADGLSAWAAQRHGLALLSALRQALDLAVAEGQCPPWRWAPIGIATQARVALGDEVGECLGAKLVLVLLGERPGLSAPDSLGAYLTHAPEVGRSDAQRNCVSNIRPDGLAPAQAALRLAWLLIESRRRSVSGVALKDNSSLPLLT